MMNKKKKILFPALLAVLITAVMGISAFAELVPTGKEWNVSFTTDKKMVSDFKSGEMDDQVSGLQPGDYTEIVLNLKNDNSETVDWYMTNKVLKSLEDTRESDSGLSGGAYTYVLTYKSPSTNKEITLFDSDTVGGEVNESVINAGREGLHEATNALEDWLYLDTFKKDQGGVITLRVALDGETQGNHYQDTLAQLQMNFAVELNKNSDDNNNNNNNNNSSSNKSSSSSSRSSSMVQTGDETNMVPYFIAAGISGLVLLLLAVYSLRERRKQRGGKA